MYSVMKRRVEALRKKAVKRGMPTEFVSLVDVYLSKAEYLRRHKDAKQAPENRYYDRAKTNLVQAEEVLRAYLYDTWTKMLDYRRKRKEQAQLELGKSPAPQ